MKSFLKCSCDNLKVTYTKKISKHRVERVRTCDDCGKKFHSLEVIFEPDTFVGVSEIMAAQSKQLKSHGVVV